MISTRKLQRRLGTYEAKPQLTIYNDPANPRSGYRTLHPTKGWQKVSGQRMRVQEAMLNKFGFIR